jgi:predicted deacylase
MEIGTAVASRGKTVFGEIRIGEINDGTPIDVPVAIVTGTRPGPCLWIQNAVHGDEYVGLGAIQKLLSDIDPDELQGTIVAIPVLNIMAYRAGSRMAPQDGLDMNRTWPGAPMETAMHLFAHTELVCHKVLQYILRYANAVLDVHDAGWMGIMSPYAAYYSGNSVAQQVKDLAFASGLTLIWETEASWVAEKVPGSIKTQMGKANIPSITLEVGGEGRLEQADVERMYLALLNSARHLGMLPGKVEIPETQHHVTKGHWLRAYRGGVLWSYSKPNQPVRKGELLAETKDFFGRTIEEFRSPADGFVLGYRTFGTVSTGQYVVNVVR